MKNTNKILVVLLGVLLWSSATVSAQNQKKQVMEKEAKAVESAVNQFYVALNAMFAGDLEPMKSVWSHADDVSYMGPAGGIRIGWEAVLADWSAQAALKLGGKIKAGDLHMTVGPQIAVVINNETGENVGPDGNTVLVSIRATHIFRKEKGQWKMIGDHTDLLPFLQK